MRRMSGAKCSILDLVLVCYCVKCKPRTRYVHIRGANVAASGGMVHGRLVSGRATEGPWSRMQDHVRGPWDVHNSLICVFPNLELRSCWHYVLLELCTTAVTFPCLSICCPGCPGCPVPTTGFSTQANPASLLGCTHRVVATRQVLRAVCSCTASQTACKPRGHPPDRCARTPHYITGVTHDLVHGTYPQSTTNSQCNLAFLGAMSAQWATVTCKLATGAYPGLATMHVAIAQQQYPANR